MFSPLCTYVKQSPYHSGKKKLPTDRITVHCYVGLVALKRGVEGFYSRPKGKEASCNYVISYDGQVGGVCDEVFRSWCSSSEANDTRAVTIEVASANTKPYEFPAAAYNKLIELTVDIMKRYKKKKLIYFANKNTALKYVLASDEMLLTLHKWFSVTKACPGQWFINKIPEFVATVNSILAGDTEKPTIEVWHIVVKGENLTKIAKAYGTTKQELQKLNPKITNPNLIYIGQKIRVR